MPQPTGTTADAVQSDDWFFTRLSNDHATGHHRPGAYATCPACILFRARLAGVVNGQAVSNSEMPKADHTRSVGVSGVLAKTPVQAIPRAAGPAVRGLSAGRPVEVGEAGARGDSVAPVVVSHHAQVVRRVA
jgi:hypothetical protein